MSLLRCENLQDVIVGEFEESKPPLLLFSLLSTLSSPHLARLTIDFAIIPGPHWSEWDAVDNHLLQMAKRCDRRPGLQVVLRPGPMVTGRITDGRKLLPKWWEFGPVELKVQSRHLRGD